MSLSGPSTKPHYDRSRTAVCFQKNHFMFRGHDLKNERPYFYMNKLTPGDVKE